MGARRLCFRSIGRKWWENYVSNSEVRRKILGTAIQFFEQALNANRLRRMGHVLPISTGRLLLLVLGKRAGEAGKSIK